jgi:hypothetical protein
VLTALELERLSFVGAEEFVQAFARDNLSARDAKRTTNLENYAAWFDRLAALVATHVCKVSVPLKFAKKSSPKCVFNPY